MKAVTHISAPIPMAYGVSWDGDALSRTVRIQISASDRSANRRPTLLSEVKYSPPTAHSTTPAPATALRGRTSSTRRRLSPSNAPTRAPQKATGTTKSC